MTLQLGINKNQNVFKILYKCHFEFHIYYLHNSFNFQPITDHTVELYTYEIIFLLINAHGLTSLLQPCKNMEKNKKVFASNLIQYLNSYVTFKLVGFFGIQNKSLFDVRKISLFYSMTNFKKDTTLNSFKLLYSYSI